MPIQDPVIVANTSITTPTISSPTISGTPVMQASVITSGTANTNLSGTSIDFTGIPSWVKRITVMFKGVSGSGTSHLLVQIGSSAGVALSEYASSSTYATTIVGTVNSTGGFVVWRDIASMIFSGHMILTQLTGNLWISSHCGKTSTTQTAFGGGDITIAATLDRVRITTVNGTDTFDAGSINILYE